MRFIVILSLSVLLAASSAWAQSNNYGRVYCTPHVPCAGDAGFPAASTLANLANNCATQSFGAAPGGYFDPSAGMDASGCLPTLPGSVKTDNSGSMTVQCCLIQIPDNSCALKCELNKL